MGKHGPLYIRSDGPDILILYIWATSPLPPVISNRWVQDGSVDVLKLHVVIVVGKIQVRLR
jgi:hypothetical protein